MTMYNADEVFEIGIMIEQNGNAFYKYAADQSTDTEVKKFFSELSVWEEKHAALFKKLKSEIITSPSNDQSLFDIDEIQHKYLDAIAQSHVFTKKVDIKALIANCTGPKAILEIALQFEKDSVVLYSAMVDLVPDGFGKIEVEKLKKEEISHIFMIQEQIELLSK